MSFALQIEETMTDDGLGIVLIALLFGNSFLSVCGRCLEQAFPSLEIDSHLSTPDAFTQDYCNIQDYFTGSFSQGVEKFDTLRPPNSS